MEHQRDILLVDWCRISGHGGRVHRTCSPVAVCTVVRTSAFVLEEFTFHHEASAAVSVLSVDADTCRDRDFHDVTVRFGKASLPYEMTGI
jgi:hypothetical protein